MTRQPFISLESLDPKQLQGWVRLTMLHSPVSLTRPETIAGRIIAAATFVGRDPIRLRVAGLRKADKRGG
jgi:hypothetical protein